MTILIILIWLILFLTLPVALFVSATIAYAGETEKFKVVGKSLLAVAAYIFTTVFVFASLFYLFIGAEPRELGAGRELIALSVLSGYSVAGWLLCSFVNGNLIKSWTHFSLDSGGKPRSIFGAK
jgi:hypothetical protein